MNRVLYNKFDKSRISQLPRVTFPGKIVVVLNEAEAEKAVNYLLSRDIIGIDTETRPVFRKVYQIVLNGSSKIRPFRKWGFRWAMTC